ncbi:MAG TPA: J domain-containing protein [Chloroflexia bacterium]|nr:J domain-containing protein [Chloroflexia bacterium]
MTELRRKPEVDYYKVLQVDSDAEPEVIEAAYRALSKKYHPDVNRAPDAMDRMAQINSAYNILSDPSKRRDYNYLRSGTVRPAVSSPRATSTTSASATPVYQSSKKPAGTTAASSSSFNPSTQQAAPKPPPKPAGAANNNSFRPQGNPTVGSAETNTVPSSSTRVSSGPNFYESKPRKSRAGLWLLTFFTIAVLAVGAVLGSELFFGNPLKTNFLKQANSSPVSVTPARSVGPTLAATTPQPAEPTNREQVTAYLNNPDLYQGRVTDAGLTSPDVLQLRLKLAGNGAVLNSDSPASGRPQDDLDVLRQSEATAYNLVYTLFGRFADLNRINLVLTDPKDKVVYRADVPRSGAYAFYSWHNDLNPGDPADAMKAARQDHILQHYGTTLDDNTRAHINAPSDANLQAELQNTGLSAFSVTNSTILSVNYFQVRNQAETAVDFARIIYTLYTRFPSLDRLQITASSAPDKPVKVIDRQLFNQIGTDDWAHAAYGSAATGGDRIAQTLVAALPGSVNDLKVPSISVQNKFKTPVQIGDWAVVTENVDRYDSLALEGQRFNAGKDRQYLVVRVALRNMSDSRMWLFPGDGMLLVDTRGSSYTADPTATLLYVLKTPPSTDPPPGPLDAGKQGAVYVVFNVPSNTNLSTLRLQFTSSDKRGLLELS